MKLLFGLIFLLVSYTQAIADTASEQTLTGQAAVDDALNLAGLSLHEARQKATQEKVTLDESTRENEPAKLVESVLRDMHSDSE